jgi:RES domain-containing protein
MSDIEPRLVDIDVFEEFFAHAVESWFTADIACCDSCFDGFVRAWPAVYLRDMDFQCSGISLDSLYEGSKLSENYSESEFSELVKHIKCPRCFAPLGPNIWPYNFPFDPPEGFEDTAAEIASIAGKTPFLLLSHPFAERVYKAIHEQASTTKASALPGTYFRGRTLKSAPKNPTADFDKPPNAKTAEGRYNHAGNPALYLASDLQTAFLEMRSPQYDFYAVELVISSPLKVLDLTKIEEGKIEHDILAAVLYSSLLSTPRDTEQFDCPQYVFSRFVADCARAAGFGAIRYPSTRATQGHNLVLLPPVEAIDKIGNIRQVVQFDGRVQVQCQLQ